MGKVALEKAASLAVSRSLLAVCAAIPLSNLKGFSLCTVADQIRLSANQLKRSQLDFNCRRNGPNATQSQNFVIGSRSPQGSHSSVQVDRGLIPALRVLLGV